MAKRKRSSNEHNRRSREEPDRGISSRPGPTAMSGERRTLMRADAVLRCVAFALEYDDWRSDEPDYAEAIDVARNLISQAVERLE
jgi:hypothetical protein